MKTEFDSLYILTTTPGLITQVDIRPQHMDTRTEFMTVKGFKNRDKKKKEAHGQGIEKTTCKLPGVTYSQKQVKI